MCTNGLLINHFLDVFSDNPYLTCLIALDGLEQQNDLLRGPGVYTRVTQNIERLKALKRPPYIGVEFTVRPENVGVMHAFCRDMVRLGVDWIVISPCLFISQEQVVNTSGSCGNISTSHPRPIWVI